MSFRDVSFRHANFRDVSFRYASPCCGRSRGPREPCPYPHPLPMATHPRTRAWRPPSDAPTRPDPADRRSR
ncbi:hypothetical protein [Streptomyces canarius]